MTDVPPSPPPPPIDPEKVARQRHFAIGLFRLSGAFIVMFGFLAIMQRFSWVQGDKAKAFDPAQRPGRRSEPGHC